MDRNFPGNAAAKKQTYDLDDEMRSDPGEGVHFFDLDSIAYKECVDVRAANENIFAEEIIAENVLQMDYLEEQVCKQNPISNENAR